MIISELMKQQTTYSVEIQQKSKVHFLKKRLIKSNIYPVKLINKNNGSVI